MKHAPGCLPFLKNDYNIDIFQEKNTKKLYHGFVLAKYQK